VAAEVLIVLRKQAWPEPSAQPQVVAAAVVLPLITALLLAQAVPAELVQFTSSPIAKHDHRLKEHHLDAERRPLGLDIV